MRIRRNWRLRCLAVLTGLATIAGVGAVSFVIPAAPVAAAVVSTSNLAFTPLSSPVRIADTRSEATDPATYAGMTLAAGKCLIVDIPSAYVPADAGAIVAQLTAVNPTAPGYLSISPPSGGAPCGAPDTSNVNFTTGQTVGNQVTVGLGIGYGFESADGVQVNNGSTSGSTDFTLDLYGYFAPIGDTYTPVTPTRIVDTRSGSGYMGAGDTLTGSGSSIEFEDWPTTATAVVLNVAVTNTTASSYLQCYPTGSPPSAITPTVNQNWVAGETLSTEVLVGVGSGGEVTCTNDAGNVDLVVDLNGYFNPPGTSGDLFTPLQGPVRLCDTRATNTRCPSGAVANGASVSVPVDGVGGIPSSALAAALDVADVAPVSANFLTVYPAGITPPLTANVNFTSGDTYNVVPNASYAEVGSDGAVEILNGVGGGGATNMVVDASGYFAAAPPAVVSVTADPSNMSPGSTSTVTVTVATNGAQVIGDPVVFTSSGGSGCGTLSSTSGTTNISGQVTVTYTSPTTVMAGCTIVATESQKGQSGTTMVQQGLAF